jgi:hypothetical protein
MMTGQAILLGPEVGTVPVMGQRFFHVPSAGRRNFMDFLSPYRHGWSRGREVDGRFPEEA